mgnify:CR=1 FL=1
MDGDENPLNQINNQELTPGIVTTSINKPNNLVTHDEVFRGISYV